MPSPAVETYITVGSRVSSGRQGSSRGDELPTNHTCVFFPAGSVGHDGWGKSRGIHVASERGHEKGRDVYFTEAGSITILIADSTRAEKFENRFATYLLNELTMKSYRN